MLRLLVDPRRRTGFHHPAGTQHGETTVLSRRGLPPLRGGRRGDEHVVFELVVPTDLDDEQRDAAERLAESLQQQPSQRR